MAIRLTGTFRDDEDAKVTGVVGSMRDAGTTTERHTDTSGADGLVELTFATDALYDARFQYGSKYWTWNGGDEVQVKTMQTWNSDADEYTLSVIRGEDAADQSVEVAEFYALYGNNNAQDNDEGYISLGLGNDKTDDMQKWEAARLTWVGTDVSDGSEDGRLDIGVMTGGSLADELALTGAALYPSTTDGLNLGGSSNEWAHVYASAATITGDITNTGDITIDADNKGLVLGDGQDVDLFFDGTDVVMQIAATAQMVVARSAVSPIYANAIMEIQHNGANAALSLATTAASEAFILASSGSSGNDVSDGTDLFAFYGRGYHTAAYYHCGKFKLEVDGACGAGDMPGRWVFETTPAGGSATAEAFRISANKTFTSQGVGYIPGIDLVATGNRIDLDTDNDTSIRASADDVVKFEIAGTDELVLNATELTPEANGGLALGTNVLQWGGLELKAGGGIYWNNHANALLETSGKLVATGDLVANDAAGPGFINEAATTTNPTLVPNKAEEDTGIGWASDTLHFVGGGASLGNISATALTLPAQLDIEGYAAIGNGSALSADYTLSVDRDFSSTGTAAQLHVAGVTTVATNQDAFGQIIGTDLSFTTHAAGTHGIIAALGLYPSAGLAGNSDITVLATLYVNNAPVYSGGGAAATTASIYVGDGPVVLAGTTNSSSATTGELQVAGGAGFAKDVYLTQAINTPDGMGADGEQLTSGGNSVAMDWAAAGSLREFKHIHGWLDPTLALDRVVNIGKRVALFTYRQGKDIINTGDFQTEYAGVLGDEAPWAMHHHGRIFDPVSAFGHTAAAITALQDRVRYLEGQLAAA